MNSFLKSVLGHNEITVVLGVNDKVLSSIDLSEFDITETDNEYIIEDQNTLLYIPTVACIFEAETGYKVVDKIENIRYTWDIIFNA